MTAKSVERDDAMQLDFDDDPDGRPSKLAISISVSVVVLVACLIIAADVGSYVW